MTKKESLLPSLGLWSGPALRRFRSEIDFLFEELLSDFSRAVSVPANIFESMQSKGTLPKINVPETDENYSVDIAVAGFSKEDVKLEVKDNDLIIKVEKNVESEEEGRNYLRKEISSRSFQRAVRFPCRINAAKSTAEYRDGIIYFNVDKDKKKDPACGVTVDIN